MKKKAMLYEALQDGTVRCNLCSHRCTIADAHYGFCGVRRNERGTLYTHVYAEAIASHVDPIEKKPLYHFFPGSTAFSIATVGCNFHCGFCQNWQISQASKREDGKLDGYELKPAEVVREAKKRGCKSISYTYTEPTVFFEYAYDTAKIAKEKGLSNSFVTNGYMTQEAIDTIRPYLDACNVDLKSFNDDTYRKICKGSLAPVLESIRHMKASGIWVEITTLVVPGMNDSDEELAEIATFIRDTGKEIPWHISRFHPDYHYTHAGYTPLETLRKAEATGKRAGLKYVYLGNAGEESITPCAACGAILIKRIGYSIWENHVKDGTCAHCSAPAEGVW